MKQRPIQAIASPRRTCAAICCIASCLVVACGGNGSGSAASSASLTLGGSVAHLVTGSSVALQNMDGDTVTVSSNGTFTFPKPLAGNTPYDVKISMQPTNATCSVSGGSGTIMTANVTSIVINCAANAYSISGNVTGLLAGRKLVLQNNGGDDTTVSADSGFIFSAPVASGANYAVTVRTQPAGQSCAITNGSGTVTLAEVTTVTISCSDDTYNVGVTVSGLNANGLVLQNNGVDNLDVSSNARFNFNTPIASGSAYAVTVMSQPAGETCVIANGNGTIVSSNVNNVTVACVPNTYQISGSLTGMLGGGSLVLQDNGGDRMTISANGNFSFPTAVASGANYAVTVATQPAAQSCAVGNGSGNVAAGNVSNVSVACSNNTFNVTATISGLNIGTLVLQDNGGDTLSILSDGSYDLNTPLASNSNYNVTILTQPAGENCSVSNGSGTIGTSNVTNVGVACVTTAFSIGGTVSGLGAATIALQDNGGDDLAVSANGAFTFATPIASGAAYAVTILTQPMGQQCTVSNGSGTVGAGGVANIDVSCPNVWTWIGGSNMGGATGVYGKLGVAALNNMPGARTGAGTWRDPAGNLWMFGGEGNGSGSPAGFLNDLWEFNPAQGTWTWIAGSNTPNAAGVYGTLGVAAAANTPGARRSPATWTDASGNLWMFGGNAGTSGTSDVEFNDLWEFNPTAGTWTWISGSNAAGAAGVYGTIGAAVATNVPGARSAANFWRDSSGNFWLFGGGGYPAAGSSGCLDDLWILNTTTDMWTWVGGSNTISATAVYGTQGSATSANTPGGRCSAASWTDSSGNVWLFGGYVAYSANSSGMLNDLWEYEVATGAWVWISGSNTLNAAGAYGTLNVAAAGNTPGARESASTWTDSMGNLWLFGGYGSAAGKYGPYNDLWSFNPSTGNWRWAGGSKVLDASGVYGTLGVAASGNIAGARSGAAQWTDTQGNFWLLGGDAFDSAGNYGYANAFWEFVP